MRAGWRKLVRRYHLWCAREDVLFSGLQTPAGLWVCDLCRSVVLSPVLFRGHLASAHQVA